MALPEAGRLERPRIQLPKPEDARRRELAEHVASTLYHMRRSKLTVDRAVTELFREIGYNQYPAQTQQAWRREITDEVQRTLQAGQLESK